MPKREYTIGSGNVFADLGLPKPDDLLAKAELASKIVEEIERRRLTQSQAAALLGIDQPKSQRSSRASCPASLSNA